MIWEEVVEDFPRSNYIILIPVCFLDIQKPKFLEKNSLKLYRKYRKILDPLLSILIFLDNKIIFMKMVKYKIK